MLKMSVKPINGVDITSPYKPLPGLVIDEPVLAAIDPTPLPGNIQPVWP